VKLIDVKEVVNKYKDLKIFKVKETHDSITIKFNERVYFKFYFDSNYKIKSVYVATIGEHYIGETPIHVSLALQNLEIKCEIEKRYKFKIS
jgi:hypothetical protein